MLRYASGTKKVVIYTIVALAALWIFTPIFWAITNSFKPDLKLFEPGAFLPWLQYQPTLKQWRFTLDTAPVLKNLSNSVIVAVGATAVCLFIGSFAGYALSRYKYRLVRSGSLMTSMLAVRILPPVVLVIPIFLIMMHINLLDTRLGLIIVNVTFQLPYAILIMHSSYEGVPLELEESAIVDGANEYQIFFHIAFPLAINGLVAAALIIFAFSWNELLFALTLTGKESQTVPVLILASRATRGVRFGYAAANTLVAIAPPILLTILLQRRLATGLTMGAVKG